MTTSLQTKLQNGHDKQSTNKLMSDASQARLDEIHRQQLQILDGCLSAKKAISQDADLSDTGRATKIKKVVSDAQQRLEALRSSTLAGLKEHERILVKTRDSDLFDHDPNNMFQLMRERELRDRLTALAPQDRAALYYKANETNDIELLRAIERAPAAFPLLDGDTVAMVKQERFERKNPADARLLQDVQNLSQKVDGLIGLSIMRCETLEG